MRPRTQQVMSALGTASTGTRAPCGQPSIPKERESALLKLINAGLGRTGTTSLKVALERLGFGPCYHMFDIITNPERLGHWERIVCDAQQPDWDAVFEGYTSVVDGPPAIYYRQIMEAFPEAKMILTIRDAEGWYRSTHDTLYQFALRSMQNPPEVGSMQYRLYRMVNTMIWSGLFGGRFSDKEYAMEVFGNHNDEVVQNVDPDNLLVYDVRQGWEPLCAFLGVGVPPEDFPHVNDTESMRKLLARVGGGAGPVTSDAAP